MRETSLSCAMGLLTPDLVGRLSIYQLYGMPLSKDEWAGTVTLIAIGVGGPSERRHRVHVCDRIMACE